MADELDPGQRAARRARARTETRPRGGRRGARSSARGRAATPTPAGRCSRGPARPRASRTRARRRLNSGKSIEHAEVGRLLAQARARARDRRARSARRRPIASATPIVATSLASTSVSHAGRAQALAADAEHLDVRAAAARSAAHQVRAVQVAGRLAGDQQDAAAARRHAHAPATLRRISVITRRAACAARTSVSTLSRMTCATSSARSPSQPVTGGGSRARTACTKASISSSSASPSRDLALLDGERRLPVVARLAPADAHPALVVVDRDVGVGLEDAQLALALQRDAARRDVGDAAVGEAQARVGDVDRRRQHRDADRLDRAHAATAPCSG